MLSSEHRPGDPFNLARKFFHLFGLIIPAIYYFNLLDYIFPVWFKDNTRSLAFFALIGVTALFLLIEFLRFRFDFWQNLFMKTVGRLLKEKEQNKMHGSVPYVLATGLVIGFMPREVAIVSILFLTFGDPVAAYVGGRFGTLRFKNGKSLQGTLGGIIGAAIAGLLFMVYHSSVDPESAMALFNEKGFQWAGWLIVIAGAVMAFILEVFSTEGFLDDNMTIPVGSGILMTLLMAASSGQPALAHFFNPAELFIPL